MTALVHVNVYDKDPYARRWGDTVVPGCATMVVSNGPAWGHRRAPNTSVSVGYRETLSSTDVSGFSAVVSVHAKTWLPDLGTVVRLLELLRGRDAVLLSPWSFDHPEAECLFLMAYTADAWRAMTGRLMATDPGVWNEVAVGRAVADMDACRVPCRVLSTQDGMSHRIDTPIGLVYGCEPSGGNMGFGHWRTGDYRSIVVSDSGVVVESPVGASLSGRMGP